jgi:hypothetical protein
MKLLLTVLPWLMFTVSIVWTFPYVLRTGRMARAVMVNWIAYLTITFLLCSFGFYIRGRMRAERQSLPDTAIAPHPYQELLPYIPDGPNVLLALVGGWGYGLVPAGIAKVLYARRRRLAGTNDHEPDLPRQ